MSVYPGKFDYADASGALLIQDACNVSFDAETCVVTPRSGLPLAFDLGDVDSVIPGEWDLQLNLFTGKRVHLRQFGKLFSRMSGELIAAWRDRNVRCLLLEDMEEISRFEATAALGEVNGPAQVRLYRTNIAVLPSAGVPFQWRLADVDSVWFDEQAYSAVLERCGERLAISKLAKRTDEFMGKLRGAVEELRERSARTLNDMFPFLGPDRLQRVQAAMPEGRSVRLSALAAIHPKLADAVLARAVDPHLKPYFDALRPRLRVDSLMVGFKFVRDGEEEPEEAEETPEEAPQDESIEVDAAEAEDETAPVFFWFFIPLANSNVVAWEAGTGSGRATYFFRTEGQDVEKAVATLTRGLALVNFRREPVYLSDDSLQQQPKFRRYAIGSRKLPDLRALRQAMLGRAIHSSVEKWQAQVDTILRRA